MALRVRELTERERHELERRARSRTEAARVVERARLILAVAQGQTVPVVAAAVGLVPDTGRQWVKRFNAAGLDGLADRQAEGLFVLAKPFDLDRLLAAVERELAVA